MADYSIQQNDLTHKGYVAYAAIMAVLYCFGIPAVSWCALNAKKEKIQKLQLLAESIEELDKGGTLTTPNAQLALKDANAGLSQIQRKKSIMSQELVSSATRRFSGVGVELNEADGAALKENLLKLDVSLKLEDPWLVGLSPLYKDYQFQHWWFEVSLIFPPLLSSSSSFCTCSWSMLPL
jgi:hypothetical protein